MLKNKFSKLMSLLLVGATMLSTITPNVYANSIGGADEKGTAYLYKMDNVDSKTGCGDYLLEVKLEDGWQPYQKMTISTTEFTFCTAYDKGYTMGDTSKPYVWENTKGCTLEDASNGGNMIIGKVTNPTKGVIEVPMNICSKHRKNVVYGNEAGFGILIEGSKLVSKNFRFKDALPISERGNQPDKPTTPDKPQSGKTSVKFQIGNALYFIMKPDGSEVIKYMEKGEEPYMTNGRTLVPVRYAGEALGCSIEWNPAKREAIVKSSNNSYRLPLNSQYAIDAKGVKYDLGAKTVQKNGRTFVAVGALGRLLNCDVVWDSETQSAIFTQK